MSVRYLVPCACGQTVEVAASQAGQEVVCACGASFRSPALRSLRELPTAGEPLPASSGWGPRQGVAATGIVLALLLAGGALACQLFAPEPPEPFDAAERTSKVRDGIDQLTPAEALRMWYGAYRPLAQEGFFALRSPVDDETQAQVDRLHALRNGLLIAAGASVAAGLAASVAVRA